MFERKSAKTPQFCSAGLRFAQTLTVSALCAAMLLPGDAVASVHPASSSQRTPPLTQDQRVLQALNRLTFGPRPGDVAAVEAMGLNAWFEQQLHPDRLDDAALQARLAAFPAMQLSQPALMARFPDPQMIRQMGRTDAPLPADPVEHAIYADTEAAYQDRIRKASEPQQPGPQPGPAMQSGAADQASSAAPSAPLTDNASLREDKFLVPAKRGRRLADPMDQAEVQKILALPTDLRFDALVAMPPEQVLAFNAGLRPGDRNRLAQGLTPQQAESVMALLQGPNRVVVTEALQARLVRDIYSQRQLQAVMTDFWLNHFSVFIHKNNNEPYLLPAYERDTILPNSMGKFENLLVATAQSPAMLVYLDNWLSIGPDSKAAGRVARIQALRPNGKAAQKMPKGINENYARELMELHTLGVNGGYTQQDVIEVAKCFTGWTIDRRDGGDTFVFDPNRHEPGSKTVLGYVIPEGGEQEGLEVLHILATSPATAHFVSQKLAVRFVSDNPPAALVNRMAATFLKSDGDIPAVLTTMFRSPEFFSPEVYRAKVKTPIEFVASAVRASGADVINPLPLAQAMDRLGMPIYGMQTPNGYAWTADEWVSSNALISRMNFALVLSGNRLPGTRTDWPAVLGHPLMTGADVAQRDAANEQTEARLEQVLLGHPAAANTRDTVLSHFDDPTAQSEAEQNFRATPGFRNTGAPMPAAGQGTAGQGTLLRVQANRPPESPVATMAGLLLGSPDFQRR